MTTACIQSRTGGAASQVRPAATATIATKSQDNAPRMSRAKSAEVHLVDDRKLQRGVEQPERPKGVEVAGFAPMLFDEIECYRPHDIGKDERRENREFSITAADEEDVEKD